MANSLIAGTFCQSSFSSTSTFYTLTLPETHSSMFFQHIEVCDLDEHNLENSKIESLMPPKQRTTAPETPSALRRAIARHALAVAGMQPAGHPEASPDWTLACCAWPIKRKWLLVVIKDHDFRGKDYLTYLLLLLLFQDVTFVSLVADLGAALSMETSELGYFSGGLSLSRTTATVCPLEGVMLFVPKTYSIFKDLLPSKPSFGLCTFLLYPAKGAFVRSVEALLEEMNQHAEASHACWACLQLEHSCYKKCPSVAVH